MFKLQIIILTALVAAFVPVNAWTAIFFNDPKCSNPGVYSMTSNVSRFCDNLPATAGSIVFAPNNDSLTNLQLFGSTGCGSFVASTTATETCLRLADPIVSFTVDVIPYGPDAQIQSDLECPATNERG